ncbi:hypothetical protein AB4Z46_04505 [Variovorax sp. M-6]|uniref:hypothetical protein n=1 Tax=Variovorax sp. M-6 TaxID=3233041 RepID=UPI003F975A6E
MTTFTINDAIFKPLKEAPGVDPAALQALVNGLNRNPYANATFTQAAQRGDFVFELLPHSTLARKGGGAFFSNDRGTDPFIARGNKFAIQLDKDWFVPHGTDAATFTKSMSASTALGMVIHEADHSNRQALFDDAFKISITPTYRPELTGAARVAASVDTTMKAEVAGWYAELQTLRKELELGHLSQFQFELRTKEQSPFGKLLAVESQGKVLGLSGDALTNYVSDHGKRAIPSDYVDRYISAYSNASTNPQDVRGILAYAQTNDPFQVKTYSEEVGADGAFVSNATFNNGDRITTIDTGLSCRVIETDSAHDNADYASRTTAYDAQGRLEQVIVTRDDGSLHGTAYDVRNSYSESRWEMEIDAQGRTDWAMSVGDNGTSYVSNYDELGNQGWRQIDTAYDIWNRADYIITFMDDGSRVVHDYDQANTRSDSVWVTKTDAQGRIDWINVTGDDGSRTSIDYDQAGSQNWSSIATRYDPSGKRTTQTQYYDNGDRAERTFFPNQHPDAYAQSYVYADGHGAGGTLQFDGYGYAILINGGSIGQEWGRENWRRMVTYDDDPYPNAHAEVGPIEPIDQW